MVFDCQHAEAVIFYGIFKTAWQINVVYSVIIARFIQNIQIFVILDCFHDGLKVSAVIRVLIVVFIGKAVIIIEVAWQIKRFCVRKSGMKLRKRLIIEKKADFIVRKDCFQVGFLQVGQRDIEFR